MSVYGSYLTESYEDLGEKEINFFGTKANIKIKSSGTIAADDKLLAKVDNVLKVVCSKELYENWYKEKDDIFEEINDDPYFKGKKIKNANDLIKALKEEITNKNTRVYINTYRKTIYFCGEYWCDPEHGYSISFPDGEYVKSKGYNSSKGPVTYFGQYSDAL